MLKSDCKTEKLINELQHTISIVGVDVTIKSLQHARTRMDFKDDEVVNKIIQLVCDDFKITFTELLNNYNKGWEKKYAIGFICYYSHKLRAYKLKDLAPIFKKTNSLLSKNMKLIKNLSPNIKSEKEIYNKKQNFDKYLNEMYAG
jgi:hypothetical protein